MWCLILWWLYPKCTVMHLSKSNDCLLEPREPYLCVAICVANGFESILGCSGNFSTHAYLEHHFSVINFKMDVPAMFVIH